MAGLRTAATQAAIAKDQFGEPTAARVAGVANHDDYHERLAQHKDTSIGPHQEMSHGTPDLGKQACTGK